MKLFYFPFLLKLGFPKYNSYFFHLKNFILIVLLLEEFIVGFSFFCFNVCFWCTLSEKMIRKKRWVWSKRLTFSLCQWRKFFGSEVLLLKWSCIEDETYKFEFLPLSLGTWFHLVICFSVYDYKSKSKRLYSQRLVFHSLSLTRW